MKRRGRNSPSEETCAWGEDEFDSQGSALIEDEYSAINVGRWGGTPYGELCVCALHASSAEEFGLDLMTFKWGWERSKVIKVAWKIESRKNDVVQNGLWLCVRPCRDAQHAGIKFEAVLKKQRLVQSVKKMQRLRSVAFGKWQEVKENFQILGVEK